MKKITNSKFLHGPYEAMTCFSFSYKMNMNYIWSCLYFVQYFTWSVSTMVTLIRKLEKKGLKKDHSNTDDDCGLQKKKKNYKGKLTKLWLTIKRSDIIEAGVK